MQIPQQRKQWSLWLAALISIPIGLTVAALWFLHISPLSPILDDFLNGVSINLIHPIINGLRDIPNTFNGAISNLIAIFNQNPASVIGACITGISALFAISFKLSQMKAEKQKLEMEWQAQQANLTAVNTSNALSDATGRIKLLEEQLKQNIPIDNSNTLQIANEKIASLTEKCNILELRNNEAQQLFNVVHNPTEADLLRAIEKMGYTVTKTVK